MQIANLLRKPDPSPPFALNLFRTLIASKRDRVRDDNQDPGRSKPRPYKSAKDGSGFGKKPQP